MRGYWLLDIVRARANPGDVEQLLLNVGLDGIVEMSEEDAFCLLSLGWTILGDAT